MARYNQPEKGTQDWDEPLNENFADLGVEVTNEVATFADLPDPTGATSSKGLPRKYLVRESRVIYRDTGKSWEAVAGLGSEGSPVPGTGHFESIRTDEFFTVNGTTVADIADAVANHQYVKLRPGVTYTHDGDSTISHGRGGGVTYVDASGADIQVRGTVVDIDETSINGDWFHWYGGRFQGSNSAGEIAFDVSDSVFNVFKPDEIRDCEGGMFFYNEDLWCEYNAVSFRGYNNDVALALIGNDGSPPPGTSFRSPAQNGGTESFRNFDIDVNPEPSADVLTTCFGVYTSDCRAYTSDWNITVSGDRNTVGLRMAGWWHGSQVQYHYETPGGKSGGTAILIDDLHRPPAHMITRISNDAANAVVNNTDHPLVHWDTSIQNGGGNGTFGPVMRHDNEVVERFTDAFGDPALEIRYDHHLRRSSSDNWIRFADEDNNVVTQVSHDGNGNFEANSATNAEYRFDGPLQAGHSGTASDPAIKIGNDGAGLFVNSSGEVVVVDESGNTTRLT